MQGRLMKKILILAALSGMLIPAFASAELNYNAVDVGYSTTIYNNRNPNLFQFDLGISKSVSRNVYLAGSYEAASQPTNSITGDKKIKSILLGAGYHTPLKDTLKLKVDGIVKGNIVKNRIKLAGSTQSASGYDIAAGVRAQFAHGLESGVDVIHVSKMYGTNPKTYLNVQLGFNFTPRLQLAVKVDIFDPDQTVYVGMRFFY
jgi:hypothetical protein